MLLSLAFHDKADMVPFDGASFPPSASNSIPTLPFYRVFRSLSLRKGKIFFFPSDEINLPLEAGDDFRSPPEALSPRYARLTVFAPPFPVELEGPTPASLDRYEVLFPEVGVTPPHRDSFPLTVDF